MVLAPFPLEDSMDEQRRCAILFCRNDPGARKLNQFMQQRDRGNPRGSLRIPAS
jgi:hypothetical protein